MSKKIPWTKLQEQAITKRGKGLAVSAAAGSGKTAVLIERMIQLLSDEKHKIPADRLLAVTFTKEAAAQMREKLAEEFAKKLKEEPDNEWLLEQQNLLQLARISTINSFCLDLVKSNLNLTDFNSGIKVLEENVQELIYDTCKEEAMRRLYTELPDDYRLLSSSFTEKILGEVIKDFYYFRRSLAFRDKWLSDALNNFDDPAVFDRLLEADFKKAGKLIPYIKAGIDRLRIIANFSVLGVSYSDHSDLSVTAASDDTFTAKLEKNIEDRKADDITGMIGEFSSIKLKPLKTTAKKFKDLSDDIQTALRENSDKAKSEREYYKAMILEILDMFTPNIAEKKANMQTSREILRILTHLCDIIDELAMEQKLERNGLTFSDAELMAKDMLVTMENGQLKRTELAEAIRDSHIYEVIFIDEFQDVNNLQEIVFRVLSDTDDLNIMGKNVFIVGDVKQAIYKFRLSNPELFVKTVEDARNPANSEVLEPIFLNQNFRSRQEIIDFVNFSFDGIMSSACGGVDYNSTQELVQGARYDSSTHSTEVMFIDNDKSFKDNWLFSRENFEVAKCIRKMIDDGEQVCKYDFDNDTFTYRACTAGDFCILVQTNAEARAAAKALEAVGLTAYSKDTDGYLESREISLVLSILRVVDNPMNDISMTALMLSPILGFTPDDAVKLKKILRSTQEKAREAEADADKLNDEEKKKLPKPKAHFWSLFNAVNPDNKDEDNKKADYMELDDKRLQEKCIAASRLLIELRFKANNMKLDRFISYVYERTNMMGISSLFLDADKKRANLRLLTQYAAEYEKNSPDGVTGFLRFIDSIASNKSAFAKAVVSTEGEGSVYIKTYHASKGLEFPFVFLTQLDREFKLNSGAMFTHNELGCAFRFLSDNQSIRKCSVYYKYLREIEKNDAVSEAMRLYYVGCTRAKEKLFVCYAPSYDRDESFEKAISAQAKIADSLRNKTDITEQVQSVKSMLGWVTMALMRAQDTTQICGFLGTDDLGIPKSARPDPDLIFFDRTAATDSPEKAEGDSASSAAVDMALLKKLREKEKFSESLNVDDKDRMPAKMTVTEIVSFINAEKGEEEEEHSVFFPNLMRLDETLEKLSAAEKGTFTHKFMELASYEDAAKSVKNELDRLVREGYFTKKEASGVYVDAVEAFFKSDIGKRIMSSKNVLREFKFLVSYDDLGLGDKYNEYLSKGSMLQGIADCVFEEDDGYVLVDYKTDRFRDATEFSRYDDQLALYKAALDLILDKPIKECRICSLWLLKTTGTT